jgi:hypothetical protein
MYLTLNTLSLSIPADFGRLMSLTDLRISTNLLSGRVPTELGLLSSRLSVLWLQESRLTGTIPTEMAKLTRLEELLLYLNRLTGSIQEGLCSRIEEGSPALNLTTDCDLARCDCGCGCSTFNR